MGRVLSNNFALRYVIETALGVPDTSGWKLTQPNAVETFGSEFTHTERNPLSPERQREKGVTTDEDSGVSFSADLTLDSFVDFVEGFVFSVFKGPVVFRPTSVTATHYVVASGGDLDQNTLIFARGFTNSENNGVKVVGASSTSTNIITSGLVAETPAPTANATVEVCGWQGATADIRIDSDGNITSEVAGKDFTELPIQVGSAVYVGGTALVTQFATAANRGYARVRAVAEHLITVDKRASAWSADTGTGKTIHLFFGRFVRNVAVDHADYLERSFTFEGFYKNLQTPGPGDEYEYARGNYCNEMALELPLADKAGASFGFVGTTTDEPTTSRRTGASAAYVPVMTKALSTARDIARLRVQEYDEDGLTTDFKNLTVTLNNNVTGEKVLAQLGAKYLNTGNFNVDLEGEVLFTNSEVIKAVRSHRTVTMDFALRSDDGAIYVDIPSLTLGGGARNLPANESVTLSLTGMAHKDAELGYSLGVTVFPHVPYEHLTS